MKALTIRLDQGDMDNIQRLQVERYHSNVLNKTVKAALRDARKYFEIRDEIREAIKIRYELQQGMIEHLNAKYFGYDTIPVPRDRSK